MSITCGVGTGTGLHVGVGIDLACGTSPDDGAAVFALHDQAAKSMNVATAMILRVGVAFRFTSLQEIGNGFRMDHVRWRWFLPSFSVARLEGLT